MPRLRLGEPGFNYHMIGGEFQSRSKLPGWPFCHGQSGPGVCQQGILGVDGISLKHGCTVPTDAEAEVVRHMIERTKGQVIIVADQASGELFPIFKLPPSMRWINLSQMHTLIFPPVKSLAAHNISCLLANSKTNPA